MLLYKLAPRPYSGERPRLLAEVLVGWIQARQNQEKEIAEKKEKQVPKIKAEVMKLRRP